MPRIYYLVCLAYNFDLVATIILFGDDKILSLWINRYLAM